MLATAFLKLAAAVSLLIVAVCLAVAVSIWSAIQCNRKPADVALTEDAGGGESHAVLAKRLAPLADVSTRPVAIRAVVGVAKIDPCAGMGLDNVAPVELDLSTGRLRLANGRPICDPQEVNWTMAGEKVWEQSRRNGK